MMAAFFVVGIEEFICDQIQFYNRNSVTLHPPVTHIISCWFRVQLTNELDDAGGNFDAIASALLTM